MISALLPTTVSFCLIPRINGHELVHYYHTSFAHPSGMSFDLASVIACFHCHFLFVFILLWPDVVFVFRVINLRHGYFSYITSQTHVYG
jgi:hypothetical protein